MKTIESSKKILIFAAFWPFIGVLLHVMAFFGGYSWYEFLMAPPLLLESVKAGTWLAPLATFFVSGLMAIAGLYALSGAEVIFKMPLLKLALVTLSILFILRGMLIFHLMWWKPEVIDTFRIISSGIFLICGIAYALGTYLRWPRIYK